MGGYHNYVNQNTWLHRSTQQNNQTYRDINQNERGVTQGIKGAERLWDAGIHFVAKVKNTGAIEQTQTNRYQTQEITSDTKLTKSQIANQKAHDQQADYYNQRGGNNQSHNDGNGAANDNTSFFVPQRPQAPQLSEKDAARANELRDLKNAANADGVVDEKEQKKIDKLEKKIGKEDMAAINQYNEADAQFQADASARETATAEFRDAVRLANTQIDPQKRQAALEVAFDKLDVEALKDKSGEGVNIALNGKVEHFNSPALAVEQMSKRQAELRYGTAVSSADVALVQSFKVNPELKEELKAKDAAAKQAAANGQNQTGTGANTGTNTDQPQNTAGDEGQNSSTGFPAITGALAQGTRSTHANVPKIDTAQVAALQEILAVNDPALAAALQSQAGGKGSYGPKTEAALIKATGLSKEEIHKLDFSKGIPAEIADKLGAGNSSSKTSPNTPVKYEMEEMPKSDANVKALQEKLIAAGYDVQATGVWDEKSKAVVMGIAENQNIDGVPTTTKIISGRPGYIDGRVDEVPVINFNDPKDPGLVAMSAAIASGKIAGPNAIEKLLNETKAETSKVETKTEAETGTNKETSKVETNTPTDAAFEKAAAADIAKNPDNFLEQMVTGLKFKDVASAKKEIDKEGNGIDAGDVRVAEAQYQKETGKHSVAFQVALGQAEMLGVNESGTIRDGQNTSDVAFQSGGVKPKTNELTVN